MGRGILAISISAEQQRAQIWSRELQNACSLELPAGPATARERGMAEQGIAGQWGQLARCTGPGTTEDSGDEPSVTLMS